MNPAPGWYPHPNDSNLLAEWNGSRWTGVTRPNLASAPPPTTDPVNATMPPPGVHLDDARSREYDKKMMAEALARSRKAERLASMSREADSAAGLALLAIFIFPIIGFFTLFKALGLRREYIDMGESPAPKVSVAIGLSSIALMVILVWFYFIIS